MRGCRQKDPAARRRAIHDPDSFPRRGQRAPLRRPCRTASWHHIHGTHRLPPSRLVRAARRRSPGGAGRSNDIQADPSTQRARKSVSFEDRGRDWTGGTCESWYTTELPRGRVRKGDTPKRYSASVQQELPWPAGTPETGADSRASSPDLPAPAGPSGLPTARIRHPAQVKARVPA